jgi:hypothetical protein
MNMMKALFVALALLMGASVTVKAETFADVNKILDETYGWKFNSVPPIAQGMTFKCNFPNRRPVAGVQYSPVCIGDKPGLRLIVLWRVSTVSPNLVHQNITSAMNQNGSFAGGAVSCAARDVRTAVVAVKCTVPFNNGTVGNAAFLHMSLRYPDSSVMDFSIIVQNTGAGRDPVEPVDPYVS